MQPGTQTQAEYFDIVEAGIYLGIVKALPGDPDPVRTQRNQLQTMYRWVRHGRIPCLKIGSRLFFKRAALDEAMRQGAHQSCRTSQALPEHTLHSLRPSNDS